MGKIGTYLDNDVWCEKCDKDTPHEVYSDGHERDSSGCHSYCLVCGWDQMRDFYIDKDHLEALQDLYKNDLKPYNDLQITYRGGRIIRDNH